MDELELFRSKRMQLADAAGRAYEEVRGALTPNYLQVWLEIFTAYVVIALSSAALIAIGESQWGPALAIPSMLVVSFVLAYAVTFLMLWFHEASHYNIHPRRETNDVLANIFLGFLRGLDIKKYRSIHFDHHRFLGKTNDPEHSYFEPLGWRYVIESLVGIRAARVLRLRGKITREKEGEAYLNYVMLLAIVFHGVICTIALIKGAWVFLAGWIIAFGVFHPFLGSLRQLLEHRKPDARADENYEEVEHGAYSRVFPGGFFAHTFGGAGFDRHLIHHWDAQLSCTRFKEMESFLEQTELADFYRSRKIGYVAAFRQLFH